MPVRVDAVSWRPLLATVAAQDLMSVKQTMGRWSAMAGADTMPAMKRRVFTILSALSLLLCVLWIAIWIRSQYYCDYIGYKWPDTGKTSCTQQNLCVQTLTVAMSFCCDAEVVQADRLDDLMGSYWETESAIDLDDDTFAPLGGSSKGTWPRASRGDVTSRQ